MAGQYTDYFKEQMAQKSIADRTSILERIIKQSVESGIVLTTPDPWERLLEEVDLREIRTLSDLAAICAANNLFPVITFETRAGRE